MLGKVFTNMRKGIIVRTRLRTTGNIMYGARAMNRQLPFMYHRQTEDFDIYSNKPRKDAMHLEGLLDKDSRGDFYYVKPALHKGTFKVMDKGHDNIKGTQDDLGIADFSRPTRRIRTISINGIRYAHLSERVKDAKRSLKEPIFAFRHEKDRKDLWMIKQGRKLGRLFKW